MSQSATIRELEADQLKKEIVDFNVGDTIKVFIRIIEGDKERLQAFTGTVIARKGSGLSETFSMHRISFGEGVERVFLLHSPRISRIEVMKRGKVRRSKLYYLRTRSGKAAKVQERLGGKERAKSRSAAAKAQEQANEEVSPEQISEENPS
ncbi:MAG: 50S ribosomal protein L19 [Parachlamydiales bacterium]|nr:50S ribosomal protein L19 [Parachlamydiales bacterium]